MTITINGTTGISGVDGSSSTPAFKGNDSNTGISFGTDTVTINTGGTARVTTDASGNVGIGVVPSAWNLAGLSAIQTRNASFLGVSNNAYMTANTYFSGSNWYYMSNGNAGQYIQSSGQHIWYSATSGTAGGVVSFSQHMTLDASGNLGIGQTSPAAKLDVNGTAFFGVGDRLRVYSNNVLQSAGTLDIGTIGSSALIFNTTNAERMRLDSSGNLGLGVTPSAWGSGISAIQLKNRSAIYGDATVVSLNNNAFFNGTSNIYIESAAASQYYQSTGQHVWRTAPSGTAGNAISFTQAMTLDASGNLGIGVNSPSVRTEVSGSEAAVSLRVNTQNAGVSAGNYSQIQLADTGTVRTYWRNVRDGSGVTQFAYNSVLSFLSDAAGTPTERARITSDGRFLVGTATGVGNDLFSIKFNSGAAVVNQAVNIVDSNASGSNSIYIVFRKSTEASIGTITRNGTSDAVLYNTTSDYRLKENVRPIAKALDRIMQLEPSEWDWKSDGSQGVGFIAHKVQAIRPQAVTGTKDAVDADGKPIYQGMDASFLIADLTAAIQELKAEVDSLKAQLQGAA